MMSRKCPSEGIPQEIKIAFYKAVLLGKVNSKAVRPVRRAMLLPVCWDSLAASRRGRSSARLLLNPSDDRGAAESAARALGTIQNYDAVPALVKALTERKARAGTIAKRWAQSVTREPPPC